MAEYPSLPLFTDAYLADTRHLSTLQHGAYLLMLMSAWREPDCALPNDDTYLARITGLDRRTWAKNKQVLLSFWHLNGQQKWVQGRLVDERKYVEQQSSRNSAAAKSRWLKNNNGKDANAMPKRCVTDAPTPTLIDSSLRSESPPTPQGVAIPDWLPKDLWRDFREHRRKLKKPMTERAERGIIRELEDLKAQNHDPVKCLEEAITSGWQKPYAPKPQAAASRIEPARDPRGGRARTNAMDLLGEEWDA